MSTNTKIDFYTVFSPQQWFQVRKFGVSTESSGDGKGPTLAS